MHQGRTSRHTRRVTSICIEFVQVIGALSTPLSNFFSIRPSAVAGGQAQLAVTSNPWRSTSTVKASSRRARAAFTSLAMAAWSSPGEQRVAWAA